MSATIDRLIPAGQADLASLIEGVREAPADRRPFSDSLVSVCADFARRLGREQRARRYPELTALAFWMRRTEIERLRAEFSALESDQVVRVPRGLVFHVPPANVDTMFVYSWLLSLLCGNRNIVRLSGSRVEAVDILCDVLRETLSDSEPGLAAGQTVVTYGHEDETNQALSSNCDLRVVWGGDHTVDVFRRFPLNPQARELVFPDRFSFAALRVSAVQQLDDQGLTRLTENFFNDAFWFDQMGCSSPRLVVWVGDAAATQTASARFFERLARTVEAKGYSLPAAARMARFTFECQAILDRPVAERIEHGAALARLRLESLASFSRDHSGGGLFFEARLEDLADLGAALDRRDQTLTHFGFEAETLRGAVLGWNGRGLDRLVPVGQALQFARYWDGMDLLSELTRSVWVEA